MPEHAQRNAARSSVPRRRRRSDRVGPTVSRQRYAFAAAKVGSTAADVKAAEQAAAHQ